MGGDGQLACDASGLTVKWQGASGGFEVDRTSVSQNQPGAFLRDEKAILLYRCSKAFWGS